MNENIIQYITSVNDIYQTDETTEHSFRGSLETLLKSMLPKSKKNQTPINVINEPKRKEYGAPDFELRKGDVIISFIETKDLFDKDLRGQNDKVHKEQFDRYKKAINTIAFTDYLEFVLYEKGEEILSARIAELQGNNIVPVSDAQQFSNFQKIIQILLEAKPQPIKSAKVLAETLAAKAKIIASILSKALEKKSSNEDNELHVKLDAFKKFLVHDMSEEQFADFYAQTIVYGLFIARIYDKTPATFTLQEASELIPSINPFLKKIFKQLALAELHSGVKWIVEELVEIFKVTDMERIMRNYGKDPLVHFYEEFLSEYNPKIREEFGVWYTPKEVVSFIVDAVDTILRTELNVQNGLADNRLIEYKGKETHKVQILDPATGTGTFLAVVADKIREHYKNQEGLWPEDVVQHIVPRLNAFEYLMAPYTMAHLKLATSLGLDKIEDERLERLNIFLTNSLEEDHPESTLPFAKFITDESNAANVIKRDTPVMVVMGNPPYNEKSANTGEWIMNLMDDYKQEPGKSRIQVSRNKKTGKVTYKNTLKGANPKGINNDYCKFIRLGQNFVEKTNEGVLAYITANTYLDSRLFRGMRYELMKSFDKIYVLNLHGSTMRKESTEEVTDQCVFDIRQGVAIIILVKQNKSNSQDLAKVYYKDIYGKRSFKLEYLSSHSLQDVDFTELTLDAPLYTFRIIDPQIKAHYDEGFKIDALMPQKVQGFKSDKDLIAIQYQKQDIEHIVEEMRSEKTEKQLREEIGFKDTRDWKLEGSRQLLKVNKRWNMYFTQVQYRPFDIRWTYLHKAVVTYPRPLIQSSIFNRKNTVLCLGQQGNVIGDDEWSLVYCSTLPTDINVVPRGGIYLFPMFTYDEMGFCLPNFSHEILKAIEQNIGLHLQDADAEERAEEGFLAVDLIDYIYAVLHSTTYRDTYHDFLQNDFPTIPYPTSADYFFRMAELGKTLRELHQLKGITQKDFITTYPVAAQKDNNITRIRKFEETSEGVGRVWINKEQYFDGVPTEAWNMIIAGYQPLDKWLKDRKDKHLTGDELLHYQKIVVALDKTIRTQERIDEIIEL